MTMRRGDQTVLRARLGAQLLDDRERLTPAQVVSRLLAMQAQDFSSGLWAIGARSGGAVVADVLGALEDGSIVRSWPMRGTLHFVAAEDLGWMMRLGAPRVRSAIAARHRQLGLDAETFSRSRSIAEHVLSGNRRATRDELMVAHQQAGIPTIGQRGPHLVMELAMTEVVCWGPPAGTQQALVLSEEWITSPRDLDPDEALGEFVVRYLTGHGPATLADFTWWSKLTVAQARRGLDVAAARVVESVDDGVSRWSTAEQAASGPPVRATSRVLALPGFDELLLGYRDRSLVLEPEHADLIVPGGNGIFLPLITVDGRIVGTWRRRVTSSGVTITPAPFRPLSQRVQAGVRRAGADYGRFLGLPTTVSDEQPLD
ncbi:MAG TPA: winged helix DNA-binding domain-containing protein [Plantibacter sp.]|uniref:winged helix DNA-binding domain-containing protein n=1 Tax=unclassified Plantibacter TaxID=2624265 RepID=UPI002CD3F00F|nr:winged helix DNA-binding domain-containing protein [Plantibacter sp.]